MKKRRILLVTGVFPPGIGGMQSYYYNLCKHSKHKTTVLAPNYTNDHEFDKHQNFKIIRKPFMVNEKVNIFNIFRMFYYTQKTVREEKIDVTIYGYILLGLIGLVLNWASDRKYVISIHGKDILETQRFPVVRSVIKLILNKASGIITNSEYTSQIVRDLGVNAKKIQVVYPGVDDMYDKQIKDRELVSRYGLEGKYILLTLSRLVKRKGHEMVIQALPRILESIPEAVYLIVGDGPEKIALQALTRELGLEKHVIFAGSAADEELVKYYNLSDLFIMPSRLMEKKGDVEGFGIVFLEAGSCSKPVIASNTGGIAEAVIDGKTGLLVDPNSTEAIADAVCRIHDDYDLSSFLAKEGYNRSKKEFNYRVITGGFDVYFGKL